MRRERPARNALACEAGGFEDIEAWQLARELARKVYGLDAPALPFEVSPACHARPANIWKGQVIGGCSAHA